MPSAPHPPVQSRAVRLLQAFFANDDERTRRAILNLAFGDCERDPRPAIQYAGPALVFADHLVDTLLKHGCAGRGRHSLSLLIKTMGSARGRQTGPDYFELPPLLDDLCALPTRDEEMDYLQRLLGEIEEKARLYAPLRGIADIKPAAQAAALLAPWGDEEDIALLMHRPRRRASVEEAAEGAEQREYEDILAAFADIKQAALLGAPGAGKSTTLRRLAADLGRAVLVSPPAHLPIFVSLGDWRGDEGLSEFLTAHVPEIGWAAQALSKEARLILLLDGLNEVPTAKRAAKTGEVLAFKDGLAKGTPCIVSCRRDDYVGDLDLGLDTLTLEPLTPQRIRHVLRHWLPDDAAGVQPGSAERLFWQLAGDERLAGVLATWLEAGSTEDAFWSVVDPQDDKKAYARTSGEEDEIWRRNVPNPRSLLRLAANPFMLTMLYQVWAFEGELPRNRGDLFTRFIDRLLSRERLLVRNGDTGVWEATADGERLLSGLTNLAWIMQGERLGQGETGEGGFGVLTVIPREVAVKELGGEALLKKAEDATLLEGSEEIRFRHQLLQEYFTASALRFHIADTPPLLAGELWPAERWWERSGWEESAVLLAGLYSEDCTPVIRWLRDAQPEAAVQCILESGADIADRDALLRELHDAWLPRLTDLEGDPQPEARAAVGRALGRLGLDDRKGVSMEANGLPDIDWVEIRGGEFIYQQSEHRRIETFYIARYPVTNAQFQVFLDAEDGYRDGRWWRGLDEPDRNPWQRAWDIPNHPRERVSWFEAMAFCAWLSHKTGLEVRLPTEWEWERAARGTDGRMYPWGREYKAGRANIDETAGDAGPHYLARTSAVGIYPQGASPEGLLDLAGNVWEWCLNEYDYPDRIQAGGGESRVVRGGSWRYGRGRARADDRYYGHPYYRYGRYGFRLVCASPIR
jgi:formylglycine-generating enzyme required for sulfatase activity